MRTLRHDLRNHLTVIRGLLEQGKTAGTLGYLVQIAGSPALRGTKRFCDNETANVVLAAKGRSRCSGRESPRRYRGLAAPGAACCGHGFNGPAG